MRARLEDVQWGPDESFLVRRYDLPRFEVPWHFHPEIELTCIVEGEGDRCVGDHLGAFTAGDLVLLGPNLPHYWRSVKAGGRAQRAQALVVHMRSHSLGQGFLDLPECRDWKRLLETSSQGLCFDSATSRLVRPLLDSLLSASGAHRLLALLEVLQALVAGEGDAVRLAGVGYLPGNDSLAADRMRRVYDHLYAHLEEPLSLPEIAQVAGMSDAAFSRYCKKVTGRTLTCLINELRVARACKELVETAQSVSEIAFLTGFQSLSNFNRVFADAKRMSPSQYRSRHHRN
jgi:AraC-like DNA-binding protein